MTQGTGTDRAVARLVGGRYEIIGLIASGGMGEVFQAHDRVLDRTVALKVLHASLGSDQAFIERFRREATAAGRLSHPNIVQVFDWGRSEDGSAYMAMEYVDGQNLREVLTANGRLRPQVAARIASQVCAALEHARRAGLVHRDIKPENILVTAEGQVKVADFGLSRTMAESRATQAGVVLGTAHYLAPEQVEGKTSDHRADLYSLGIVIYEMLTGSTPFGGDSQVAVAYQRVSNDVPLPSKGKAGVPPILDDIVRRATARDPDKRFPSAGEMGEALRGAVPRSDTGEVGVLVHPTVAIPIGTQETVNLGRRRRPRLTRRGFIVMAALLALALASIPILTGALAHVDVPQVAGQTKAAAQKALESAGFHVSSDFENSATVPEGQVIRTNPIGGTSLRKGSTVTLVVSSGPVTVEVPKVVGLRFADAHKQLTDLGLVVERVDAFSFTVPKDAVIAQDRDSGVLVNQGSTVTLTVSKGKERAAVPNVVGQTESAATQALIAAGFTVTITRKTDDKIAAGLVISQAPLAGAKADKGSAIALVISQGPPITTVPNIRCMTQKQAADTLASKGLKIRFVGYGARVVDQDPGPGAEVPRGSTVTAYLAPGAYC